MVLALALIWLFFWHQTGGTFLRPNSISNLFLQMSVTGMLACGMVLVIIAGEIDLSVGSLLGLLGGLAAILTVNLGWNTWLAVAAVLAAGAALGLVNGCLTTRLRVPSFIVGLGGMLAYRGLLQLSTDSVTIAPVPDDLAPSPRPLPPALSWLMVALIIALACGLACRAGASVAGWDWRWRRPGPTDSVGAIAATAAGFVLVLNQAHGVPLPVLILLALLGVFSWITSQTVFGRHVYAVGGNVEASRLSGVNVKRVKLMVFMLMGLMCAFAGIVTTARGGGLAVGRRGRRAGRHRRLLHRRHVHARRLGHVYGALIGALVMASLDNGMQQMNVDTSWQMIVKGAVLVLAVWIDVATRSERA